MSTTDYRAMCAELLDELELWPLWHEATGLIDRARALLAQPEPEGLTDEELLDLADWEVWDHQLLAFARAAIARHSRPTPRPVAVSERLPGPGDCDEQGRCWMFGNVEGDWRLISATNSGIPKLKYCFSHWLPSNTLPTPEAIND